MQPGIPNLDTLQVRNNREQLIKEIVEASTEKDKKKFARFISIRARELKLTDTDLHYLLQKKNDQSIKNYTAFVRWSLKVK